MTDYPPCPVCQWTPKEVYEHFDEYTDIQAVELSNERFYPDTPTHITLVVCPKCKVARVIP